VLFLHKNNFGNAPLIANTQHQNTEVEGNLETILILWEKEIGEETHQDE
jgi:hypothetical protein